MKPTLTDEKRGFPRYAIRGGLTVHILSSLLSSPEVQPPIQGTIQDISQSGLSIIIPQAMPLSSPIRCEIRLANLPVAIPTLAQVRWVKSSPGGVRAGLQFLL